MRILMVNLPFAGHTNPTLPLAKALVTAGHEVVYVNAECMRSRIEATGAAFVPYRDFPADPTEDEKTKRSFRACWDTAMALTGSFDLLLYEMFFYPGFTLAEKLGAPCVRQWSQPAWSVGTWLNKPFRYRMSAQLLDQQIVSAEDRQHMGQGERSLSGANLGDRPALNIVYLPEEMQDGREDFGEDWVFLPPPVETPQQEAFLPWEALPRPIVYVSMGSIMSDRGFCRQVVKGMGGRDMTVILNTGRVDPASLGDLPGNVRAYAFVPQMQVLAHADVFATHCGMNSVNEALLQGVPMVCLPVMNDQPGNAARLVELGVGRRVSPYFLSGKKLCVAVEAVAQDADMRERAAALRESLLRQQDLAGLIRRIEEVAQV